MLITRSAEYGENSSSDVSSSNHDRFEEAAGGLFPTLFREIISDRTIQLKIRMKTHYTSSAISRRIGALLAKKGLSDPALQTCLLARIIPALRDMRLQIVAAFSGGGSVRRKKRVDYDSIPSEPGVDFEDDLNDDADDDQEPAADTPSHVDVLSPTQGIGLPEILRPVPLDETGLLPDEIGPLVQCRNAGLANKKMRAYIRKYGTYDRNALSRSMGPIMERNHCSSRHKNLLIDNVECALKSYGVVFIKRNGRHKKAHHTDVASPRTAMIDILNRVRDETEDDVVDYDEVLQGLKAIGIDPTKPTSARPGTEDKVLVLQARYAAGVPLWHENDCGYGITDAQELKERNMQRLALEEDSDDHEDEYTFDTGELRQRRKK